MVISLKQQWINENGTNFSAENTFDLINDFSCERIIRFVGNHALNSRIYVLDVRDGELKHYDYLHGDAVFEPITDRVSREDLPIVGYWIHMRLSYGFQKSKYFPMKDIEACRDRMIKRDKAVSELWNREPSEMSRKTALVSFLCDFCPIDDWDLESSRRFARGLVYYDPSNVTF